MELTNKKAGNIIVHHYLKNTDGTYTTIPVAPDETQSKPAGEQYTTSPKTDLTDVTPEKTEIMNMLSHKMQQVNLKRKHRRLHIIMNQKI